MEKLNRGQSDCALLRKESQNNSSIRAKGYIQRKDKSAIEERQNFDKV